MGRINYEVGIKIYRILKNKNKNKTNKKKTKKIYRKLYIKQIINKDILCVTGKSI